MEGLAAWNWALSLFEVLSLASFQIWDIQVKTVKNRPGDGRYEAEKWPGMIEILLMLDYVWIVYASGEGVAFMISSSGKGSVALTIRSR